MRINLLSRVHASLEAATSVLDKSFIINLDYVTLNAGDLRERGLREFPARRRVVQAGTEDAGSSLTLHWLSKGSKVDACLIEILEFSALYIQ